jgi:phage terminase large subunit-like protein
VSGILDGLTTEMAEAELYRRRFYRYVKAAWSRILPSKPFVDGWHIGAMSEHLQAVSEGQIQNLWMSVAPRHMKSLCVSVKWPTWDWIDNPSRQFLFGSYGMDLAMRDAVRSRRLMDSPWYQERWGCRCLATPHAKWCTGWRFTSDQNVKTLYENDRTGRRLTASVEAGTTGEGGDILVLDDPIDIVKALSETSRRAARTYVEQVWIGRRNDPRTSRMVGIAQRTHEEDVTAFMLKDSGLDFVHLCLPTEYRIPPLVEVTKLGFRDPRTTAGQLLWPERFGPKENEQAKRNPFVYAAQHDQNPTPAGGGIIKRHWFRFWQPANVDLGPVIDPKDGQQRVCQPLPPESEMTDTLQSWDLNKQREVVAIRKGQDPDPVAGGVFSRRGGEIYLRERTNKLLGIVETIEEIAAVSQRWPQAGKKLIEYAANGPAVIALMRRKLGGFLPVTPVGSKTARMVTTAGASEEAKGGRAMSASEFIASGGYYLPHPLLDWCERCGALSLDCGYCGPTQAPWVWAYVDTFAAFPNVAHDDDVDVFSQAAMKLAPWIWQEADADQRQAVEHGTGKPPETVQEVFRRQMARAMAPKASQRSINPYRR